LVVTTKKARKPPRRSGLDPDISDLIATPSISSLKDKKPNPITTRTGHCHTA
jgi:hypothetical protein